MIQSIERAAAILGLFRENRYLSIAQISEMTGLAKTTAHGIVSTLKETGYLDQDPVTRDYCLGITVFELGCQYRDTLNLRSLAMPFMRDLSTLTKDTVQLAVLRGTDIIYLYKIATPMFMTFAISEGVRAPAHCVSTGRAILAQMKDSEVRELFGTGPLEQRTPFSCGSVDQLLEHLETTRKNGYAREDQEVHFGLGGIAAAVFDHNGSVCASLCLSFPNKRCDEAYLQKKRSAASGNGHSCV